MQHLKQRLDLYDRKDLSQSDRMHLSCALGNAHDDILDFEPAFDFFIREIALENRCSGMTLKRIADCFQFSRTSLQRAVMPILSRLGLSGKPTNCPCLFWGCRAPGQHWLNRLYPVIPWYKGAGELPFLDQGLEHFNLVSSGLNDVNMMVL